MRTVKTDASYAVAGYSVKVEAAQICGKFAICKHFCWRMSISLILVDRYLDKCVKDKET
jgi:hypothetical protein